MNIEAMRKYATPATLCDIIEKQQFDLAEVEAMLMNLNMDLTAQLAHKIIQVNNQPTPLHLVKGKNDE